jgi:RNA recognition motif-containing protein
MTGRRVFVTKLSRTVDESQLFAFFSRWCAVRAAFVAREGDGTSKCFGFVELVGEEDVETALSLDGYQWNNRQLIVARAKEKIGNG